MLLPTIQEGRSVTPSSSKLGPDLSALVSSVPGQLARNPQATLGSHSSSTSYIQSEDTFLVAPAGDHGTAHCGLKRRNDVLHRRSMHDAHHEERISTTAVLAGVLGGFGGLCIVGCVAWIVKRKKFRARREARRAARREREVAAKPKTEVVSNTVEGSERTVRPDGDEGGLLKKQELQPESAEASPRAAYGIGASPRIQAYNHPYAQQLSARPQQRDGSRPSSANQPPADQKVTISGSTDSLRRLAGYGTTNPLAASPSPLARETPQAPSTQVLSRPRPPQEESSRPETPTLPVHPPLAFGPSSATVGATKTTTSSPTPRVRPQTRRDRAGIADGSGSSDTEYFSDASHNNAAPRQVQMVTNMGGIGGGQGVGNVSRTDRTPRVQQTVVLDLPPAYSPN